MATTPTTRNDALMEEAVKRLTAFRDELRLKAHLAGMEAKDQWEALRPQLEAVTDRIGAVVRRGAGEARVKAHLGSMEVRDAWSTVEPRLLDLVARVKGKDGARLLELLQSAEDAVGRLAAAPE